MATVWMDGPCWPARRCRLIYFAGRYKDAGINEFILFLMPGLEFLSDRFLTDIAMLERIGLDALPVLRTL